MKTTMAVARTCAAAIAVLALLGAGPALAHSEGLTPYRYVVAPPGTASEGPAEAGVSTQPIGPPGFAGTTDNQMQLTLPEGALPAAPGQRGVRVQLLQLDPADLPPLPAGLEPEGNGYRVVLAYAPSGAPVPALAGPATLGLSAPAAPTAVFELVGREWKPVPYTPVAVDEGFSSVLEISGPGTFLQAYDPASASASAAAAAPTAPTAPAAGGTSAAPVPPGQSSASDGLAPEPATARPVAQAQPLATSTVPALVVGAGAALALGTVLLRRRLGRPRSQVR